MDGNNRWSKKHNHSQFDAYTSGAKNLIKLTNHLVEKYNIQYISAFALSNKNLKRSPDIIKLFKNILKYFLDDEILLSKRKFNIVFKGDISFLDKYIIDKLNTIQNSNKKYKNTLIIFLNYSGKLDLINSINKSLIKNKVKFTLKTLHNNISTSKIPDPDLLIRTGGFQRISDYMLYQISFTELMFSKKLWPNFQKKDLDNCIDKFKKIERKFGL